MKVSDLLSMSAASLVKRKLRTLLTILGVVIGIASIVVMVSLGLGLNKQSMDMIEEYGGLTTITVTEGNDSGGSFGNRGGASTASADPLALKLSDETVDSFKYMKHVDSAYPVLTFTCILKTGAYENEIYQGYGYTGDYFRSLNWEVKEGRFPEEGKSLEFLYGNLIKMDFSNTATGLGYYDTGKIPDIDLMNAPMFTIFDTEAYYATKGNSKSREEGIESSADPDGEDKVPPKKYLIPAAGILKGEEKDDYKEYSYSIYCDLEALKSMLRRVYKNKVVPGQPVRKNGKPYKEFYYSSIMVKADSVDNVSEVQKMITDMGYNAYSNYEWIEQTRKQSRSQQAMLGGIGAVSLLVAAIGIANTMMMSIYERTKEIGVMKVLGCDLNNIQQLFLLEAVLIGFFGGIAGDLLSFTVSFCINSITGSETSLIPVWLLAAGLIFAMLVGAAAGYFPSRRAMELSPLAAIRNE